jgi:hypothetical protein
VLQAFRKPTRSQDIAYWKALDLKVVRERAAIQKLGNGGDQLGGCEGLGQHDAAGNAHGGPVLGCERAGCLGASMADGKPKPRAKTRKRPRAPSRDEYVRYLVAIENWDWSYSFGLDGRNDSVDPNMEHRQLMIGGRLLHPRSPAIKSVELCLLPRHDLDQERRKDDQPTAVGSVEVDDGKLTALLPIPKDSLTAIMLMSTADRFKFANLGGARLH